jgi:hypothetical protein
MKISKEALMKLDKEELVKIITSLSEANEKMIRSTSSILGSVKFAYPHIENLGNELNTIRREIKYIRETCETEAEFENKLKVYFDSAK